MLMICELHCWQRMAYRAHVGHELILDLDPPTTANRTFSFSPFFNTAYNGTSFIIQSYKEC